METIKMKIKELLKLSNTDSSIGNLNKITQQDNLITELKELSKNKRTLLGRTILYPVGDGFAVYLITQTGPTKVQLSWLKYGDEYIDKLIGKVGTVTNNFATKQINAEDQYK